MTERQHKIRNIDRHTLLRRKIVDDPDNPSSTWESLHTNPFMFFIAAPDSIQISIWRAITTGERRTEPNRRAGAERRDPDNKGTNRAAARASGRLTGTRHSSDRRQTNRRQGVDS